MKTVETILVELQDELHYAKYPSEAKVKIFKEEHLDGDYFPLHMVKTACERYASQNTAPQPEAATREGEEKPPYFNIQISSSDKAAAEHVQGLLKDYLKDGYEGIDDLIAYANIQIK